MYTVNAIPDMAIFFTFMPFSNQHYYIMESPVDIEHNSASPG